MQVVMGSNPSQIRFFYCFMQLPCCFTLYKELLYQSSEFSKVYYHILLCDPIVNGTSVNPILQVCSFIMLVFSDHKKLKGTCLG
jgi:hypothetical protein